MAKCLIKVFIQENSTSIKNKCIKRCKRFNFVVAVVYVYVLMCRFFKKRSQLLVFRMMDEQTFFPQAGVSCVFFTTTLNILSINFHGFWYIMLVVSVLNVDYNNYKENFLRNLFLLQCSFY